MSKLQRGALCVLIAAAYSGAAVAAPCGEPTKNISIITPETPLTLSAVMAQIANISPDLRRAALETKARQAEIEEAWHRQNPVLGVEIENFAGSGAFSGFNQSQTTISLQQTFELGNKRSYRRELARANATLANAECGADLRQLQLKGATLYFDLIAALQVADLANESAELAQSLVEVVEKRVNAGAAAPPELSRAKADAIALLAVVESTKARSVALEYELAAMWSDTSPQFAKPLFQKPTSMITDVAIQAGSGTHPLLDLASAKTTVSEANRNYEQSRAIPDITLNAAFRRFEAGNENALLFGFSVPLPIFDTNSHTIKAAEFRNQAKIINRQAVERDLISQQNTARSQLISAQKQLSLLGTDALIEARSAYDASVQGYRAGKFDLTTTLNTRQAFLEAQLAVINAARTVNIQNMKLRSLTGATPFSGDIQ